MTPKFLPSRITSPSLLLWTIILTIILVLLISKPSPLLRNLFPSNHNHHPTTTKRPLLIYTKPRKTGSTFITSMLGNAVLRSGGRVASCKVSGAMTGNAPYYGLLRAYDMIGCHKSLNDISITALRSLPRDVVFVTSTREPLSWFISAAVWVYERRTDVPVETASLLKKAVDYALDGGEDYIMYRRMFLRDHGLSPSSTRAEIEDITNIYSYVFDHATAEDDVNRALVELGYSTSRASSRREGVYDPSWIAGYRVDDIRNATMFEKLLYDRLMGVREALLGEDIPWANPIAGKVKTFYSAAGMGRRDKQRVAADPTNSTTVRKTHK